MSNLYALLLKFDPHVLHDTARSWRGLSHAMEDAGSRHRGKVNVPLHVSWKGDAAQAGFRTMARTEQLLDLVRVEAEAAALTLDTVADRMFQAQTNLTNTVRRAQEQGMRVGADGTVDMPAEDAADRHDPDAQNARRALAGLKGELQQRIDAALRAAQEASDQGNAALGRLDSGIFGQARTAGATSEAGKDAQAVFKDLGLTDASLPDGKDPQRSADWWKSLTPEQRDTYLALHPGEIGRLDGLPTTVRDEANRLVLDQRVSEMQSGTPSSLGLTDEEYRSRRAALEEIRRKLEESDGNDEPHRMFLLGLDPDRHNGRAIVSTGNPDNSQHTAVFVPGTGTVLAGVPGQMDHIKKLQDAANDEAADGEKVAVVSWLGYETPDWTDGSVASASRGDAGAEDMRRFTNGVRVAQSDNLCGHLTVIGHSYGTYAVGSAARGEGGLHVDDIVSLASPGMGVDNASELNIDPGHVWVGTARNDTIQEVDTALGKQPLDGNFGGQRIEVDTSGHGGYWKDSSVSLHNQGKIIVGRPPVMSPKLAY
ncbi:alpha/beta hydrolase [Kitasatospora indigofera]|uniref:alpha/beta hydrolase n=1 Tax=Kitasatospora indigofera TaxID=67307 RepID=UPI003654B529